MVNSAFSAFLLTVGLIGGTNFSTFLGSDAALVDQSGTTSMEPGYITRYVAGFTSELEYQRMYGLRAELLFSVRGGKYESELEDQGGELETQLQMRYLDLPVMAYFRLSEETSVMLGPYLSWYISGDSQYRLSLSGRPASGTDEPIERDLIRNPDAGLIAGASYNIDDHVSFHARYGYGVRPIPAGSDKDMRHGWLQIMMGFEF